MKHHIPSAAAAVTVALPSAPGCAGTRGVDGVKPVRNEIVVPS